MRRLLRFVAAVAAGALAISAIVIGVPLTARTIYRQGATTVAARIPPLKEVTEEGSTVYAANGKTVLAHLQSSVTRKPVPLRKVAHVLIRAVLDTEDHRFYLHGGIDFPSTLRALLHDSSSNGLQGGSTITQQLVKQVYLTSARKLSRKLKEAVIANRLEKLYTKNQILDAYLNTIYLGSGAYGVEAASEAYWGKPASKVNLAEAAMLAGLIQDPSGYDPVTNPTLARQRRTQVLGRMLHYHDIVKGQYDYANGVPLPTTISATIAPVELTGIDAYYVRQVENELLGPGSPLGSTEAQRADALFEGGLKIYTNLSPTAEAQAESAVAANTPADATSQGIEENLVSMDPANGDVTALIGGQNYQKQQFDVATQGRVQPGSGFKIFTLLAGLERGQSIFDDVDGTSPCAIPFPGNDSYVLSPAHNDEGDDGAGVTTVLGATANSLNCAYLRMAHQIGLPAVFAMAESLGITHSELSTAIKDQTPSAVIGTAQVEPIQMAAAYATLASGGTYHTPQFVNHIVDRTGDTIYTESTQGKDIIPANIVAEADQAFLAVVEDGTGTAAAIPGREVAGKTGTNSGPTSSWFNGYTPQLETTVWMGNPNKQSNYTMVVDGIEVYGGTFPAMTVHAYMAAALANQPVETFPLLNAALLPAPYFIPEVTGPTPAFGNPKPPKSPTSTAPGVPPTIPPSPTTTAPRPSGTVPKSPPTTSGRVPNPTVPTVPPPTSPPSTT